MSKKGNMVGIISEDLNKSERDLKSWVCVQFSFSDGLKIRNFRVQL